MSGASDPGIDPTRALQSTPASPAAHDTPPISIEAALDLILQNADPSHDIEYIPLADATGYVLAQNITADRDAPPFDRSMMDGYAVLAADVVSRPLDYSYAVHGVTIFAGQLSTDPLTPGSCRRIMTGAPLPPGADCVIPVEETETETETESQNTARIDAQSVGRVRFTGVKNRAELRALRNVAPRGQDVRSGAVVLVAGRRIDSGVMNTLAAFGYAHVPVRRLPRVVILSTGDEIVDVAQSDIRVEQIRDSNYYALCGSLAAYRIAPPAHQIIPDRPDALRAAINAALSSDLLIITGGVSMGDADFVPGILAEAGVQKIFHRVNVKPGKPLWFGHGPLTTSGAGGGPTGRGPVVFGLPGNPVSCQVGWKIFIEPYLRCVLGLGPAPVWRVPLARGRSKHGPRAEFFPARLTTSAEVSTLIQLEPLRGHSSGDVRATIDAQGFALHPAGLPELAAGELVDFYPQVGLAGS